MSQTSCTVLILDDDPSHLKLYSWIVEQSGCKAVPVQVRSSSLSLPHGEPVNLVLMDYRYNSQLTAVDIVENVKNAFPSVPIIVFSEVFGMPADMKGRANGFIRKGEPQELVNRLKSFQAGGSIGDLVQS